MKSKIIAVSAIAAGFVAIFLTLGAYIEFIDLIGVVFASVFVLLPIYFRSYKGCFLTYLAGGIIAFMFSGFNILSLVFPAYFAFFGIYPIIKCLVFDGNFSKKIFTLIGLIWCIAVCFGIYFYYTLVMGAEVVLEGFPSWAIKFLYPSIGILAVLVFFAFDKLVFMSRILVNKYLGKVVK